MPRNAAGTYTLPLPPVVTGTTITSNFENTTDADIATELTNSLDRNGRGGMTGPFKIFDGTVSAPGLAFTLDPDNGLYRIGNDDWGFAVGGSKVMELTATGISMVNGLTIAKPSLTASNGLGFTGLAGGQQEFLGSVTAVQDTSSAGEGPPFAGNIVLTGNYFGAPGAPNPLPMLHVSSSRMVGNFDGSVPVGPPMDLGRGAAPFGSLYLNGSITAYDSLTIRVNNVTTPISALVLAANGSLGVGTDTPNYAGFGRTITLESPTNAAVELSTTRVEGTGLPVGPISWEFRNMAAGHTNLARFNVISDGPTANQRGGTYVFAVKPDGATGVVERMRITQAGLVGIGTTGPTSPLHVAYLTAAGQHLALLETLATSALGPYLAFKDAAGTPNQWRIGSGFGSATDGIFTITDVRQAINRLTIDTGGTIAANVVATGPRLILRNTGTGSDIAFARNSDGTLRTSLVNALTSGDANNCYSYMSVSDGTNTAASGKATWTAFGNGNVALGGTGTVLNGAIATTATSGFGMISTCPGPPTGVPVALNGYAPLVCDSTNKKMYAYIGGAWTILN